MSEQQGDTQELDMEAVITEINAVLADHQARVPFTGAAREAELRKSMLEIQNDHTLSAKEKAQKMQDLMFPKRPSSRNSELSRSNSTARTPRLAEDENEDEDENEEDEVASLVLKDSDRVATHCYVDGAPQDLCYGCAHYRTNCKIRAECCGNWYTCRFCHDESEDHTIDRHAVRFMMCMHCQTPQKAAKTCRACEEVMANYYCEMCKLWDDDPRKEIYHCDGCKICRRGKSKDYVHCDRCTGCISAEHFPEHKCLEGSLQSNCPICGENLFNSTSPVIFMPCGHSIHHTCHLAHTCNSYQCPICLKSVNNMSVLFTRIEEMLSSQQMPKEYKNMLSEILCNDCEKKSTAKFHFIYHRCAHCRSYNTKFLRSFRQDGPPDTPSAASTTSDDDPASKK